jgi:toxin ParE1/3/4
VTELRFSDHAERDLAEIVSFIARDNPAAAAQFVERLQEHCQLLTAYPLVGRARDELAPGLRSLPFGRYVIFYRALDDGAEIVCVLHGARDIRRILRGA